MADQHSTSSSLEADHARAHLAAIVDSSDDAILSKTLDGIVVSWNKAAERLYGYTSTEIIGRSVALIVPRDRADELPRFLEQIRRGQRIEHHETVRVAKDGRRIPVSVTISPIRSSSGTVVGASTIARDITQNKRVEQELAAARDQALEASRLKSEFVASMSHEIRTPLNGVIGMTSLLLGTELDVRQRDYAETIRRSGEVLLTLINDILDFSKIESGRLELEEIDLNVFDNVQEANELLAEQASVKGLELRTLIDRDVPAGVRGDPGRLRQVLMNLIGNAIKFTENGEVVTRVGVVEEHDDRVLLRFEVRDTGIGIRPDIQKRLFTSFSQADTSSTRKYGGTGLGLAISKQLVELMGGDIGVESEEGRGSTFTFTVRLKKSSKASVAPSPAAALAGLRVLVVDDNATNRKILEDALLSWDMRPDDCESGEKALAVLREAAARNEPYSVVLLDYRMPGIDGIALAREIRNDPALDGVRLILTASSDEYGEGRAAIDAGIDAYLTMPLRPASLYDRLLNVTRAREPAATEERASEQPPGAKPARLVLVVEDNPINQKVAVHMLERMGYRSDVAANGREAVEAVSRIPYAAVLMDCQMPEMDGYEATRQIRALPGPAGQTPIIAMTAEAMKGDEQRARLAGMDDYVPKPVTFERLATALQRWADQQTSPRSPRSDSPDISDEPQEPVTNTSVLDSLHRLEDQGKANADEFLGEFIQTTAKNLGHLRHSITRGDAEGVAFAAHSLKGSVGTLGANRMADMCAEMERLATIEELSDSSHLLAQIEREFDRVCLALGTDRAGRP